MRKNHNLLGIRALYRISNHVRKLALLSSKMDIEIFESVSQTDFYNEKLDSKERFNRELSK